MNAPTLPGSVSSGSLIASFDTGEIPLESLRIGHGHRILALHGFTNFHPNAEWISKMSAHGELIAPSHPGFGGSERPPEFDSVYNLVRLYLDVIDRLGPEPITLIGFSFGGWLAAEIASLNCSNIERLVLVGSVGIKLGKPTEPEVFDIFNSNPAEVLARRWHSCEGRAPNFDAMTDEEIVTFARNWESLCLYAWEPYMYTPQLHRWLRRISCPTLFVWGDSDGVVSPAYGRRFADCVPGAEFLTINGAGHHPEEEQPTSFTDVVYDFMQRTAKRRG